VDFITSSPAVSADCHWARIEAQQHAMQPSTISLRCDPGQRRFSGTTTNVARLSLSLRPLKPGTPLQVQLDGQKLEGIAWPADGERLWLAREADTWAVTSAPPPTLKSPQRCGPFREAFRYSVLFVYGTKGTPEENAWALAKARYDAEQFWYRGNGGVEVIPDDALDAVATRERNVVLYGNADTNAAWAGLLGASPVQVKRDGVQISAHAFKGPDLACLFIRPRLDSLRASVGAVSGSGLAGLRLTDRLPYFVSGAAYPDCIVLSPQSLSAGLAGVRATGYFGDDWTVGGGEFAWSEGG
jgi:hypothetical protein